MWLKIQGKLFNTDQFCEIKQEGRTVSARTVGTNTTVVLSMEPIIDKIERAMAAEIKEVI